MKKAFGAREWLIVLGFVLMVGLTVLATLTPWFSKTRANVKTVYGKRRAGGQTSVNGTSVFGEMFRQRGGSVTTWSRLSPRLKRSDVIVWVPNSFELPNKDSTDYLETEWLGHDDNRMRTLIYVARDYDAAIEYWDSQAQQGTGNSYMEFRSKAARAKSDHAYARSLTAEEMKSEWFSIDSSQAFTDATPSDGPWAQTIDTEAVSIPVAGKLEWPKAAEDSNRQYEILLGSTDTPLIVRMTDAYKWPDGQVMLVLNGASVLNLPLVEHENRKIASALIDECGDSIRRVTFLESGPMGLPISNTDPKAYSGFDALKIWPINSILMHLIVAGILFCAMVFPIFGRPREIESDTPSNFGKHIRAMGELLALTNDRQTAMAKVQQYRSLKIEPLLAEARGTTESSEAGNPFQVSKL